MHERGYGGDEGDSGTSENESFVTGITDGRGVDLESTLRVNTDFREGK